jgi:kumamolisin
MSNLVKISGSERLPVRSAIPVGNPDPNELIDVTLILRRRAAKLPEPGPQPMSRSEFAAKFGADPADIREVEDFAGLNDLTVREVHIGRRTVVLSGTIANMAVAFGLNFEDLLIFQGSRGDRFRGRRGSLYLPAHLTTKVLGVFGIDDRSQALPHLGRRVERAGGSAPGDTSYSPDAIAQLYHFPVGTSGLGQTVAVIELGGGFRIFDVTTYFRNLGISPVPLITSVSVDGSANLATGDPNGDDLEVALDIEIIGAVAPAARVVVYFAPNTDRAFLDTITTAIHDDIRSPTIISISWGMAESEYTEQARRAFHEAFQEAALFGITVCVATGDDGSRDLLDDGRAHVDFPAVCPNVLACGGTRLESDNGTIKSEVVWNDSTGATGGGVSEIFDLPAYQKSNGVPHSINPPGFKGRGVPDVVGNGDPWTGYELIVDGRALICAGTSAVAPLWAALIARLNERLGSPLGFANEKLYGAVARAKALTDITSGSNGAYCAGIGWDACSGLGSPNGEKILDALLTKPAN